MAAEILEKMKRELPQLTSDEKAELAALLLEALDSTDETQTDAEWEVELLRRSDEIRRGLAHGDPAEEVIAQLRAELQ